MTPSTKGHLVRIADTKKVFKKSDTSNWSNKLYTETDKNHDTVPSLRIDYLLERYKESLIKPTKLTSEVKVQVKLWRKKLGLLN